MEDLTLNERIIKIRVELQNSKIKKSGKNKFGGFNYYELADFLPKLNELMEKYQINDIFTIEDNTARLELYYKDEDNSYEMPFILFDTPTNFKTDRNGNTREIKSMQDIQYLGALNTYYKRYLYLNAFGITDGEVIDGMDNSKLETKPKVDYKTKLLEELKNLGIDVNEYAKAHNLNAKTTQAQAKALVEELSHHAG